MQRAMRGARGLSLVELMVGLTLGLFVSGALLTLYLNLSRTNAELSRTSIQIENGRFASQTLRADLALAGYWGTYLPKYDNLSYTDAPDDVPTAVPAPCKAYVDGSGNANWTAQDLKNLTGVPLAVYDAVPSGCETLITSLQANTDILVVRHVEPCAVGEAGCDAFSTNNVYFQSSLDTDCPICFSSSNLASLNTTPPTITTSGKACPGNGSWGATIGGVAQPWVAVPPGVASGQTVHRTDGYYDSNTGNTVWRLPYAYPYAASPHLQHRGTDRTALRLKGRRNCSAALPVPASTAVLPGDAPLRRYISNIYWVRNYAVTLGDGVPTLMRSQFGYAGTSWAQQPGQPLVDGIEGFRVELGIDSLTRSGTSFNPAQKLVWADENYRANATNRGDGVVDGAYVRCGSSCSASQLMNTVAARVFLLARAREASAGYTDGKTYRLSSLASGPTLTPGGGFRRQVFTTTVRMVGVADRRDTP